MLAQDAGEPFDSVARRVGARDFNMRYAFHKPIPADLDTFARTMNPAISDHMLGTSLSRPNGQLKDYDARPFLKQIRVPVLFVVGENDFVGPQLVREHASLTPGARLVVIPGAGHMTLWDNTAVNTEAVRTFLREVDGRR